MSKRNDFDFFDQLFDRLQKDDFINKTISDFGREVKDTIDRSVKNKGYDDIGDLVSNTIKPKPASKPQAGQSDLYQEYNNRYEYLLNSLQLIKYDPKYRGYYREGHQEAIAKSVNILGSSKNNFESLEEYVKKELSTFDRHPKKHKDKFVEGYIDGLKLLQDELRRSKIYMMAKVKNSLVND